MLQKISTLVLLLMGVAIVFAQNQYAGSGGQYRDSTGQYSSSNGYYAGQNSQYGQVEAVQYPDSSGSYTSNSQQYGSSNADTPNTRSFGLLGGGHRGRGLLGGLLGNLFGLGGGNRFPVIPPILPYPVPGYGSYPYGFGGGYAGSYGSYPAFGSFGGYYG